MAKKVNISAGIKLDGEKEFKRALSQINSEYKVLKSGMAKISTEFADNANSIEALTKKDRNLAEQMELQKKKVDVLKEALEKAKQEYGENDTRVDRWKTSLNMAQAQLNRLNTEVKENKKYLSEAENSTEHMASSINQYGKKVKKAGEEVEEFGNITGDVFSGELGIKGIELLSNNLSELSQNVWEVANGSRKGMNNFVAATGTARKSMSDFQEIMEAVYKENYGESMSDISNVMSEIKQQINEINPERMKETAENAITLRDTFGMDIKEQIRAVKMLMDQFGISSTKAFNLIAEGAQNGLNKNDDLLDSINEYTVHYKQMGASATGFFNSLKNGSENGTFSVDKLGDAYKEFGIRVKDTATTTDEAYKLLGLDADEMRSAFAKGGDSAKNATDKVLDKLFKMRDEVKQNQAGVDLFGTMWEDLGISGVKALTNLNGEISESSATLENIKKIKYDDIGTALEGVKRNLIEDIANPVEQKVLPKLNDFANELLENKDIGENIGDVASDVAAGIVDGLEFCAKHIDQVKTAAAILLSTFIGIKTASAFNSVATSILTMKTALDVATSSQVALNVAQKASPIGIIVGAVTGLVSLLGLLALGNSDASTETENLTQAQRNLKESTDEVKQSLDEQKDSLSYLGTQGDHIDKIGGKLMDIVDKNGKVKKGYKENAKQLAEQLKKAGINVEITKEGQVAIEGQVKKQKDLNREIGKTILKQKAKNALERQESTYYENMENRKKLIQEIASATDDLTKKKKEQQEVEGEIEKIEKEIQRISKSSGDTSALNLKKSELIGDWLEIKNEIKAANKVIKESDEKLNGLNVQIQNYENLSKAMEKGNSKKIKEALYNLVNSMKTTTTASTEELKKQYEAAKNEYNKIADAMKSGQMKGNKSVLSELKILKEKALAEYKESQKQAKKEGKKTGEKYAEGINSAKGKAESSGKNFVEGVKKGIEDNVEALFKKTTWMGGNMIEHLNEALKIKSPSRKAMQTGRYFVEGAIVGTEEKENELYKKYSEMGKKMVENYKNSLGMAALRIQEIEKNRRDSSLPMTLSNIKKQDSLVEDLDVGQGDLQLIVEMDDDVVFKHCYKGFRKAKARDTRISMK